jgi:lipopolysaccharide/colanic/teichoic acid biosynthesis glycosyltransferase
MIVDTNSAEGQPLSDMQRMTKSGNIIRKCSFDELPQLFNIIKGDMSFIGPRPLLPQYLSLYSAEQMRRHDVLPGISGLAQVNGRNAISWDEKFKLDVWYVDHISFSLDCQIFIKTILNIIRREGINQSGDKTIEGFKGNN